MSKTYSLSNIQRMSGSGVPVFPMDSDMWHEVKARIS